MPSVMTTAIPIWASTASRTASLANFGGTKTTLTSAPVSFMASATEPNTGSVAPSKSTVSPAFFGLTPPTTWVPEASIRWVCLRPSEPVMPCTMTLLASVSQIAMSQSRPLLRSRSELGGALGRAVHGVDLLEQRQTGLGEDAAALVGVVAVEAHDQRVADLVAAVLQQGEGLHDAVGHGVAGGDATEDVDEDRPHGRVAEDDLQSVGHDLGRRATADVQEVGRLDAAVRLSRVGDDVERAHHEARAVSDDADLAVELDVVEVLGLGLRLQRVGRGDVLQRSVLGL